MTEQENSIKNFISFLHNDLPDDARRKVVRDEFGDYHATHYRPGDRVTILSTNGYRDVVYRETYVIEGDDSKKTWRFVQRETAGK